MLQAMINVVKQGLSRPGRTEGNHNTTHGDANLSCDLQESEANGATLRGCQFGVSQTVLAQGLQQNISKGRKPQAQLIALKLMGGGTLTEQIELMFLDAVFHLASGTVVVGMELTRTDLLGRVGGDNKVTPCAVGIIGQFAARSDGNTAKTSQFDSLATDTRLGGEPRHPVQSSGCLEPTARG